MAEFTLDTSGFVWLQHGQLANTYWEDLSPFEQGYVEALFASLWPHVVPLRGCGWCGRSPMETAKLKSCRKHGQCTHLVRAERVRLHSREAGFSDLAPETLAAILKDCARAKLNWMAFQLLGGHEAHVLGGKFWEVRQREKLTSNLPDLSFPPLTVSLGDDGKVLLTEVTR